MLGALKGTTIAFIPHSASPLDWIHNLPSFLPKLTGSVELLKSFATIYLLPIATPLYQQCSCYPAACFIPSPDLTSVIWISRWWGSSSPHLSMKNLPLNSTTCRLRSSHQPEIYSKIKVE